MYTLNCSNSYMVLEGDRISVKQRSVWENRVLKKIRIRQTVNNLLTVYMFSCRNSKKKSSPYILQFFFYGIYIYIKRHYWIRLMSTKRKSMNYMCTYSIQKYVAKWTKSKFCASMQWYKNQCKLYILNFKIFKKKNDGCCS